MTPNIVGLSAEDRQALDDVVGAFDRGWKDGLLSRRVGQIPTDSAWRLQAMAEMVKIDIDRQWLRGRESRVESYLEQFPELARSGEVSADLILAEFEARRQAGVPSDLESYLRRFPEHAGEVARRIASGGSSAPRHPPSSAGWSAPKPAPEPVPEQLGRYRILKRLGQGGMGSVFLAEDTQLGRKVALKVPHFGPDDGPDARERFFREARTAATLDHPYLCPVFDVGEVDGRLYLTMAFIEGKSLAESLKGEGLPTRQVAALVGKLALALAQAHAKGVVHRDLKPANVMIKAVGDRREPIIVDFGLALRDDGDARMTKSGQVMGTLAYMSPEQVMGDMAAIGPPADIYALGVILYELLTGRLPFNGAGLAIAGQILTQDPLPPTSIRAGIDPRIEAICLKAMAKKPIDRYASMAELAAALTGFLKAPSGAVVESAPAPSTTEPPRTTGGDRLVADLFQDLEPGDAAVPVVPKPRKSSRRPRPIEVEAEAEVVVDEEVEPMLGLAVWSGELPRWLRPAIGGGVLAVLCLVLAVALLAGKPKEGIIILKNLPENPEVFLDGVKQPNNFAYGGGPYEVSALAGNRTVEIRKNGLKYFSQEVVVKAGEETEVPVKDESPEPVARKPDPPAPNPRSPPVVEPLVGLATPDPRPATTSIASWKPLFNGKNLDGWKVDRDVPGVWSAQDGQIVAVSAVPKNQTWLFSDDEYANFLLRFEVQMPKPSDSGVGIWADFGEVCPVEINLRDMDGGFAQTGALRWDLRGASSDYQLPDRPVSLVGGHGWNAVEVESIDGKIKFSLNGEIIMTSDLATRAADANALPAVKRATGRVGFQAHTGTIRFRNVEIKPL